MFDGKTLSWVHLSKVDSTNLWLKEHAPSLSTQMLTVVYADEQTAGKGQHGKKWISPPGLNLYASLFFCLEKEFSHLSNLSQTLAISCAKTMEELGFLTQIKWPNDLRIEKRKIGGILAEIISMKEVCGVIIGVGININATENELSSIDQPATSLLVESGMEWDINKVLLRIIELFLIDLAILRKQGFSSLAVELQSFLAFLHQPVVFSDDQRSFEAICQGIDERGQMRLLRSDGIVETVYSGSLREAVTS
ncbi:MAG: biotin--[acetyl-CoA-carboxylase] ligase [Simkania sp.]|nr:biotin--[acetyl-CoA-carboxylase] ligase [Simkania sp.]